MLFYILIFNICIAISILVSQNISAYINIRCNFHIRHTIIQKKFITMKENKGENCDGKV